MVFTMGCRGISPPGGSNTSSPSLIIDLGFCRVVSYILTSLPAFFTLSQICCHRGAANIADGLGTGPSWGWLCQTWGQPPVSSVRSHPCSLLLLISCWVNAIQTHKYLLQIQWQGKQRQGIALTHTTGVGGP